MKSPLPTTASLILWEATSRWSVAWRRALRGRDFSLLETRSSGQCAEALQEQPQSLVGVEVTAGNIEQLLPAIHRMQRQFPHSRFIALLDDKKLQLTEPFLRDAGVFELLYSRREVPNAVKYLLRQLV